MPLTCFSTVRSVITSRSEIAWLERPSAISASTSRSRALRSSSASWPCRGRPTSWKPASASSRATPSRSSTESSASTTRTGSPPVAPFPGRAGCPPRTSRRAPAGGRSGHEARYHAWGPPRRSRRHAPAAAGGRAPGEDDRCRRRLGVLGDVGQPLGDGVVGPCLHPLRQPAVQVGRHRDRKRRGVGPVLQRGAEASGGQDAGMDAVAQVAELRQRGLERLLGLLDAGAGGTWVGL
jgi:hypothetical protein